MSEHRALIESVRAHRCTRIGDNLVCANEGEVWPCLTARLAEALERSGPCKCDPPGSGEEHCNGVCELRERAESAERRVAEVEHYKANAEIVLKNLRADAGRVPELESRIEEWRVEWEQAIVRAEVAESQLAALLDRQAEPESHRDAAVDQMHLEQQAGARIADALTRQLAAAREALAKFGEHGQGCSAWQTLRECTCGLAAALAGPGTGEETG